MTYPSPKKSVIKLWFRVDLTIKLIIITYLNSARSIKIALGQFTNICRPTYA